MATVTIQPDLYVQAVNRTVTEINPTTKYSSGPNYNPQYFIFVYLYKADDIREEINYHDKFISSNVFQWQSPNNMTQDSDRGIFCNYEFCNSRITGRFI